MRKTDEFFADKQRLWDQMSPEQQAAEDAAWERVMREINAARPHRPVFVDQ
jgi:predicted nucleic acid-binding protein